jgi:hypothetical protein
MSKEIKLELPAYLTLQQYKAMDRVYSLEDRLQTLYTISAISGIDFNTVKKWDLSTIGAVWKTISNILDESGKIEFYPILEFEGVQYGYTPMSKMSMAEYIDLDNLAKDKLNNINEILSILYRPIKSHKIKDMKFRLKSSIKLIFTKDKVEHLMDYYTVEDYDNDKRKEQAILFNEFPASIGLGALGFFLGVGNLSSLDSLTSTAQMSKRQREMTMNKEIQQYKNIMGGYTRYLSWESLPSFKSGVRQTFSL